MLVYVCIIIPLEYECSRDCTKINYGNAVAWRHNERVCERDTELVAGQSQIARQLLVIGIRENIIKNKFWKINGHDQKS